MGRPLRVDECELVRTMLHGKAGSALISNIEQSIVEDIEDGGMGSIRFVSRTNRPRVFGDAIAAAEYIDDDGALVSITVNSDDRGELYEVDFWKGDFSPLRRYPNATDLRLKA